MKAYIYKMSNQIKPSLGLFDLSMLVVSLVIGVGIFRTPTMIAQEAGHPYLFWLAWITGGIISLCGALTFAEIGSRFHLPGGLYKVVSRCFHPMYAFMLNWVLLITLGAGAVGVAMIGAEYINPVMMPLSLQNQWGIQLTTVAVVLLLFVLNFLGIRAGALTQNILSLVKIGMILLVCLGVFASGTPTEVPALVESGGWNGIFKAFSLSLIAVFYTYGGYQQTINFGGDIKNPVKNIPRAIFVGITIIIGLYLLVNYAYYHVLGFEGLQSSKLVAAEVAQSLFGELGFKLVSIAIFFSTVGFVNATIMSVPRMYFAMAEEGLLPSVFAKVNSRTQVQEFTLFFFLSIMLAAIFLLATFEKIVNYVMFIDSIPLVSAASSLFVLRRRAEGAMYLGYKIGWYPLVPLLFVFFLSVVTVNVAITDTSSALVGTGFFLLGYPFYRFRKKHKSV
jgi:APA family basic amino acid/polyamine antiporter